MNLSSASLWARRLLIVLAKIVVIAWCVKLIATEVDERVEERAMAGMTVAYILAKTMEHIDPDMQDEIF